MIRRPTNQDASWFLDLAKNEQLELDPPYQRRSVWTRKDRQFFLDTVYRGYPCPAVFLHKETDPNGKQLYNVVDGKQRLETILLFTRDKLRLPEGFGDSRLNGRKWSELNTDSKKTLWNYVLPVEFIDTVDETTINSAFERLNRNSRKLEPQELRHSQFNGWFITFVEAEAEEQSWKTLGVVTASRAKRMKDVQFISELLLVAIEMKLHGFSQEWLDSSFGKYDELEDADLLETEEQIRERFDQSKQYLLEMERMGNAVTLNANTLQLFYSLWGCITLHQGSLGSPSETARRVSQFTKQVRELSGAKGEEFTKALASGKYSSHVIDFYQNAGGASTELPQRTARDEALLSVLAVQ